MLGFFEKRHFGTKEKVWVGRYQNLTNVLHWHFECELIMVLSGKAEIRIGESCFEAADGDCFFCAAEELHYIISQPETLVDIVIFSESIVKDVTDKYALKSPKLPESISVSETFQTIKKELLKKGRFYREATENLVRGIVLNIFQSVEIVKRSDRSALHKDLIGKINEDFSFITFEDAVAFSGYSTSHFSRMFKQLSGMSFTEYLNIIKIEHAISLLQNERNITITSVSLKCGFSTVRNFNRVFKDVTGYSPSTLPENFIIDTNLRVSINKDFDPTGKASVLI